eukprot:UN07328
MGKQAGMDVKSTASFRQLNARVSSTLIREALAAGDLENAKLMLRHNYAISGRVIHGWKRGRELGFRTANIALKRQVCPVNGVLTVKANIAGKHVYGVANIGNKPTLMELR